MFYCKQCFNFLSFSTQKRVSVLTEQHTREEKQCFNNSDIFNFPVIISIICCWVVLVNWLQFDKTVYIFLILSQFAFSDSSPIAAIQQQIALSAATAFRFRVLLILPRKMLHYASPPGTIELVKKVFPVPCSHTLSKERSTPPVDWLISVVMKSPLDHVMYGWWWSDIVMDVGTYIFACSTLSITFCCSDCNCFDKDEAPFGIYIDLIFFICWYVYALYLHRG